MTDYKIIDIEGIGSVYAEKLTAAGIATVAEYLEKTSTPAGRKVLAAETGIPVANILRWTNHADLMRIDGIGPQYAELLEAAGVDTVAELKQRKAENLHTRMAEVNETRHLTGRVPTAAELQRMIDQAATLPRGVTY
ncbi:MAG: DUF4332 domain-containing protein [Clostridium sp.]|nr:DUF4332 domain-containing protein [Clostridium sp.]